MLIALAKDSFSLSQDTESHDMMDLMTELWDKNFYCWLKEHIDVHSIVKQFGFAADLLDWTATFVVSELVTCNFSLGKIFRGLMFLASPKFLFWINWQIFQLNCHNCSSSVQ